MESVKADLNPVRTNGHQEIKRSAFSNFSVNSRAKNKVRGLQEAKGQVEQAQ